MFQPAGLCRQGFWFQNLVISQTVNQILWTLTDNHFPIRNGYLSESCESHLKKLKLSKPVPMFALHWVSCFKQSENKILLSVLVRMLKVVLFLVTLAYNGGCYDGFFNFKLYQCKFNEVFVFPNRTCYAKSFSRKISTINAYAKYRAPLDDVWVKSSFELCTTLTICFFQARSNFVLQIWKHLPPGHEIAKAQHL